MSLVFTKQVQGQLCDPGEGAYFNCATDIKFQGLTATWLKDNKPLDASVADRTKLLAKENHFSLDLSNVQPGDSGQYSCRVTGEGGTAITCSAVLEVHTLSPAEKREREESNHPVFLVKLRDADVILSSTASFMIHVKGNPNPDVKFLKDGTEIKEDSHFTINRDHAPHGSYEVIIHDVKAEDAGQYSVVASNTLGTEQCAASISVKDAKDVFSLLRGHEKKVAPGEEPTFTWFKSGQEFDPEDRFKVLFKDEEDTLALVFQHINPEDAGLYTCVASTSTGKISCSAELSVEGGVSQLLKEPEKPKILTGLGDADSSVGGSAMLELKMRGYPRPSIKWTKDGQPITASDHFKFVYPDQESVALIINKVQPEDAGAYKVTLTNDLGEASSEGKLTLSGAPQFQDTIEDQKTAVDDAWKIVTKVSGNPELTWYKNGVPITLDSRIKSIKVDPETFELVFAKTLADDNGNWAVIARNAHGEMSQFFEFSAQMLPKFETRLIDVEANEGKQAILKCKINCSPDPEVKWFKGGTEITKDPRVKVYKDPNGLDCLTINSCSRGMAGEYEVKAINDMGTAACKCTIKVNTKPSCDDLDDYEVFEKDDFTFAVECDGNPKPVCKWTKEGQSIDTKDGRFVITENNGVYMLGIKEVTMDDKGTYQAEFTNRAGDRKVQSELIVHSADELKIPKCMSDLKSKKAEKGGKTFFQIKIRGDPIPEVKWYFNDIEVVNDDHFQVSVKENEHMYRLDVVGISEEHYGKVRVVAKNENGEDFKEASLEVQFKPEIQAPEEFKAGPGDEASLSFKIRAFPGAEVDFYKKIAQEEGEPKMDKIEKGNKEYTRFSTEMTEDGTFEVHSLIIKDVVMEDSGEYECLASNRIGNTSSLVKFAVVTEEPSFPKSLEDITTTLGSTETFECIVAGIPRPEIAWFRGDKELKKGKRVLFEEELAENGIKYKMTTRDIVFKDFGQIKLTAKNMVGESESTAIFQIVQIKPTIEADFPRMIEVKEGKEFVLTAKIDGSPPPTAIWLCEGEEIKADGERVIITEEEAEDGSGIITTLRITSAKDEDNGKYTLLVKNTAGEEKMDTMVDIVGKPKPPKVVKEIEPKEITIPGKKELRLTCKISGYPMPTIKWYRDGNEIKVRKGVLISQDASGGATLVLEKCQMTDAGTYSAKGINEMGDAETFANVTVTQPMEEPKFTSLLRSAKAVEGSPIKLEGKVSGHPQPEIKWLKNEVEFIPDGDRVQSFQNEDGTFGLIFECTNADDKGTYTAVAVSPEGMARSNGNVTIKSRMKEGVDKSKPSFVRPMGDVAVDEGQKLRITCPVKGNPIPEFSWTKDGKPIASERAHCFSDGELIGIEVINSKMEDAGAYECHLSNELGTITGVCNVKVNKIYQPPFFSTPLNNVKQIVGCDARFVCDVGCNPKPDITWTFNGKPIDDGGKYTIKTNGNMRTLCVKKINDADIGTYKCIATNKEGTKDSSGTLEIVEFIEKGKSDAPEFLKKIGDELVFRGMSARFTALVTGTPEPDYEFFFNGKPLYPTDRIHIVRERTGLIRLSMAYIEESDIGVYGLKVTNTHGEAYCEARLMYDGLEILPGQSLGELYKGFDKYTISGLPMPLPDKPLITQMSDTSVTLTWKPAIPLGPNLAPYYMVEMAEYPDGDWFEVYDAVRGITCDINGLTPLRDYRFRVSVRNRFGLSDASPYCVGHRSLFADDTGPRDLFLPKGSQFDISVSTRFPADFDLFKEPYEGYTHRPHFLKQEEITQYAVKNSCPDVTWNLYGYPMPQVSFKFEGKDIEVGNDKFTISYNRNGIVRLQINKFSQDDVGTYECFAKNDFGEMSQPVIMIMAQYPEFLKAPTDVNLIGVNGGKIECEIFGVPKPKVIWYKDFTPLKETFRVQAHHYPPETYTLFFEDYITKDEGLYTVTASNICGSISYSVIVRIMEDELEFDWMTYRRSKQIIPRTRGFEKFYHLCEEIGRGTQGVTYFVQQTIPIEADQSGHHCIEEAESKYWWLHRGVKDKAPTIDPIMVPYRFTGGNFAAKMMYGSNMYKQWMFNEFEMMNVLHHPRLVRLVDVYDARDSMTLITELGTGGELLDVITSEKYVTEIEVARIMQQVLEGLEYMHSKSIGHLGLTPLDIIFSRPGGSDIKICDFSLARRIVGIVKLDYGQPEYVAPEIVNGEGASFGSDLWPVGIMTYLLLSGVSPFRGQNDRETLQRIQMGDIDFDFELWQNVSREAKHFVANLLVYKPEERMSVRQALAHPWLQILKQPGIEISEQYQISTERLRTYYVGLKEWYANASCDFMFRRRPLSGAFTHPSCMVYPPGEPEPEPEPEQAPLPEMKEWERPEYTIGEFENPSNYQYGPDTYLMQVHDANFPARLREYLKVAKTSSAEFREVKMPIVKERRRFTDVMEEEFTSQRESRLEAWGRDDFSVHKLSTSKSKLVTGATESIVSIETVKEVIDGTVPFIREKPRDVALSEGKPLVLTCLAIGDPKPNFQWLKNDFIFTDDSRLHMEKTDDGRCTLTLDPAAPSDVGLYKVIVRNPLGQSVATCRVTLGDICESPDSPSIVAMTDTDILISWTTPTKLNNAPVISYKVQMGHIDTDIDWIDVSEDIRHEYLVVDNLRPAHGYKFRILALNKYGLSIPSIPSKIAMTPSSGASRAEFYEALQSLQAREDINLDIEVAPTTYDCETKPLKIKSENPKDLEYISELSKGRFSVTSNVSSVGKLFSVKVFDKSDEEGEDAAKREFKNLRTLRHEKLVSLLEGYETSKMYLLKFDQLPAIDLLTYLSEKSYYSEDIVADISSQILDGISYIHWRGKVYLNLEPGNILVYSGRSLGKTVQIKLSNFETTQTVANKGSMVKGTYNFDYAAPEILENAQAFPQSDIWSFGVLLYVLLSGQLPFKGETPDESKDNILKVRFKFEYLYKEATMEVTRLLMWIFKRSPMKRPSLEEIMSHRWLNNADYMLKKRERARFNTNRIQKLSTEFNRSRLQMDVSGSDFFSKLVQ
ncbi:protein Obscurin [Lepeophtheirus salmonis]|nr:obscurin-like [Lepeophtheirus salmonis]